MTTFSSPRIEQIDALRAEIAAIAKPLEEGQQILPFDIPAIDERLEGGGLDVAAVHEVAPASAKLTDDAAATLFLAGTAARLAAERQATVLWAVTRFDLYAPGLEQAGLAPAQVLYAQGRSDEEVLALAEDGLRHGSLAAVVLEVKRCPMTASRRLQLAAGDGRTPALVFRRWRKAGVCPLQEPSAAVTRWRIGVALSARLPHAGVGRPRWEIELVRQRGGNPFTTFVEACDETGRLALPSAPLRRAAAKVGAAARAA